MSRTMLVYIDDEGAKELISIAVHWLNLKLQQAEDEHLGNEIDFDRTKFINDLEENIKRHEELYQDFLSLLDELS